MNYALCRLISALPDFKWHFRRLNLVKMIDLCPTPMTQTSILVPYPQQRCMCYNNQLYASMNSALLIALLGALFTSEAPYSNDNNGLNLSLSLSLLASFKFKFKSFCATHF